MSIKSVLVAIIAVFVLIIALPILATSLVEAGAVSGADTTFVSGLKITWLLLALSPAGVLLGWLILRGMSSRNS